MAEFLKPDYFADLSDAVISDLQLHLARDNSRDWAVVRHAFKEFVRRDYADSFGLSTEYAASLFIYDNGNALSPDNRRFDGAPTLWDFAEYLRKGRS